MLTKRSSSLLHSCLSYNVPQQRLAPILARPLVRSHIRKQPRALQRRLQSTYDHAPPRASRTRRFLFFTFRTTAILGGTFFLGACLAIVPNMAAIREVFEPVSDAATLALYDAPDADTAAIDAHILSHPLAVALRADPSYAESRPHLKIPPALRSNNLTGGTLAGPGRIAVPPLTFTQSDVPTPRAYALLYLGDSLCGHPGLVHGGLLATLLDEGLARCCFPVLPGRVGMTASLKVDYRAPTRAGAYYVLKAWTTKVEGRKAWVEGRIETLVDPDGDEKPVVLVEASALYIAPREGTLKAVLPYAAG